MTDTKIQEFLVDSQIQNQSNSKYRWFVLSWGASLNEGRTLEDDLSKRPIRFVACRKGISLTNMNVSTMAIWHEMKLQGLTKSSSWIPYCNIGLVFVILTQRIPPPKALLTSSIYTLQTETEGKQPFGTAMCEICVLSSNSKELI